MHYGALGWHGVVLVCTGVALGHTGVYWSGAEMH